MASRTAIIRKGSRLRVYDRSSTLRKRAGSSVYLIRQEVATYAPRRESFIDSAGDRYSVEHSPAARRKKGITFTPSDLVEGMVELARATGVEVTRIVDPGAGTGRFTIAAARAFPKASVVAVENDLELAGLLLNNLTAARLGDRVQVQVVDFRTTALPRVTGATLFIGNPPYVRHHDIDSTWKLWYTSRLAAKGIRGTQLAGLHAHFLVKTFDLAHEGDLVCYVTAAEWLDTDYGSALRALLLAQGRDIDLALLDRSSVVFSDAMTTSAVLTFRMLRGASSVRLRQVSSPDALLVGDAHGVFRSGDLASSDGWSRLVANGRITELRCGLMLGELFSVHRGQVTGNNSIWIQGLYPGPLPQRVLFPTVTRAVELLNLESDRLLDDSRLKRVIDLPNDLSQCSPRETEQIERFIGWALRHGGQNSYIARHRCPWFKVGLREPAPIIMTYMARRPPKFVRNLCRARLINIAHGLYPKGPIASRDLDLITSWLNTNVSVLDGRTYAGGLTKFEPREVERLRLPALDELQAGV